MWPVSSRTTNAVHTSGRVPATDGGNLMRIRPSLRLARAAVVCALAVGLGAAPNAWSQSLIEALSTTYNSNPDLLASRALLRQTDESLSQAVANWRPRVSLSVEYNKLEQDTFRAGNVLVPTKYF